MKRGLFLLFIIILFALLSFVFFTKHFLSQPLLKQQSNQKIILINFKSGMSASNIVNLITNYHPLNCKFCFANYVRFLSLSYSFQAGIYEIDSDTSPLQLAQKILNGDVLEQRLTIKEGQTSFDVIQELYAKPFIKKNSTTLKTFLKSCKLCRNNLEGALLADTYFYLAGSKAINVLFRSHDSLTKVLNQIWANRLPNLPYKNSSELLIAASIIEKETANKTEKPIISAVIVNRLRKNMRLQMDPTVIYALGNKFKYPLTKKDLLVRSPYNSYLNKGLPPTPICNVGIEALYAAAHPKAVDYLYFVANGKDQHQFSNNLQEQNKAVKKLRQYVKSH